MGSNVSTTTVHRVVQAYTSTSGTLSKKAQRVSFTTLWAGYPSSNPYVDAKTGDPPKGFENQCAIKVSVALHASGVKLQSFRGAHVTINGKPAATRAEDLAAWLKAHHIAGISSPPINITGENWREKIKNKTGIVFFANYWLRPGETKCSSLILSGRRLDDIARVQLEFGENSGTFRLTLSERVLKFPPAGRVIP
jgi:hypothetical protein